VLGGELSSCPGGHPDHERHGELAAGHVEQRGGVVDELVEREQGEVHRHDLDDRVHPSERRAYPRAGEAGLGEGGVADAVRPELLEQPARDPEAPAIAPDVLADHERQRVALEGVPNPLAEGLPEGDLDAAPAGRRRRCGGVHRAPPAVVMRAERAPSRFLDRVVVRAVLSAFACAVIRVRSVVVIRRRLHSPTRARTRSG